MAFNLFQRIADVLAGQRKGLFKPELEKPLPSFKQQLGEIGRTLYPQREELLHRRKTIEKQRLERLEKQKLPEIKKAQAEQLAKFITGQYGIVPLAERVEQASESEMKVLFLQDAWKREQDPEKKEVLKTTIKELTHQVAEKGVVIGLSLFTPMPGGGGLTPKLARQILKLKPGAKLTEKAVSQAWKDVSRKTFPRSLEQQAKSFNINSQKLVNESRDLLSKEIVTKPVVLKALPPASREAIVEAEKITKSVPSGRVKQIINQTVRTQRKDVLAREDFLLRNKLQAEARGAKVAAAEASRLTREDLLTKFRATSQSVKEIQKDLFTFAKQQLPPQQVTEFVRRLGAISTKAGQFKAMEAIVERAAVIEKRGILSEIDKFGKLPTKPTVRGKPVKIAVDYQKQIKATLEGFDPVNITAKKVEQLKGLQGFIKEYGEPLNINPKTVNELERLSKISPKKMTTKDLTSLRDTLARLRAHGEVKAKLQFKYNERAKEEGLKRIIVSTNNLDPVNVLLKDAKRKYMSILHFPRVTDMADGYKNYNGANARLIKNLGDGENMAKFEAGNTVMKALEEIQTRLKITELTEKQQVGIMINIRLREGSKDAVKVLMKEYNLEKIPSLTKEDEQLINIIQKYTNQNKNRLAAVYEEVEGLPFQEMETYILPLKYRGELGAIPVDAIQPGYNRVTTIRKGMVMPRVTGVRKTPRIDVLGVFDEAIREQHWYMEMTPRVENAVQLVGSKEYQEAAGEIVTRAWKDKIDMISREGRSAYNQSSPLLRTARVNLTNAILGYKVSSFLVQPFAIFDAMAFTQGRWGSGAAMEVFGEFTKTWVNPRLAQQAIKDSKALTLRQAGEPVVEEMFERAKGVRGLTGRVWRGGLSALKWSDLKTAAGVQSGLERILKKHNVPNPKEEAEFLMNMTSGSADVSYRPLALSGEAGKTAFLFQSFFLNRWGIQAHDLFATGIVKGDWKKKFGALLGLIIFGGGAVVENYSKDKIREWITGKKLDDESAIENFLWSFPENIPLFGNLIWAMRRGWKPSIDIPLTRTIENFFGGLASLSTGKKTETRTRGALKVLESLISLRGVPGTSQLFDVLERLFISPPRSLKEQLTAFGKPSAEEEPTEVIKELEAIDREMTYAGSTMSGMKLSDEQRYEYQRVSGQLIQRGLENLIRTKEWQQADKRAKNKLVDKVIRDGRATVRDKLLPQFMAKQVQELYQQGDREALKTMADELTDEGLELFTSLLKYLSQQ